MAAGLVDAFVFFGGELWDLAACSVICEEAGGRHTDRMDGCDPGTSPIVAGNGRVHDEILTDDRQGGQPVMVSAQVAQDEMISTARSAPRSTSGLMG